MSGFTPACPGEDFFQTSNDVTRIFDNVQASVPGVTTDMTALQIWNTIEDFYIKSTYRRELVYWELDPGDIILDFDPYDNNWRVCRFLAFTGMTYPKFIPPGRVMDVTNPVPQTERTGKAFLALKPNNLQVELPYDVWTTYWEVLVNGVLSRLYMQPGKPYSDVKVGADYAKLYRSGIASARADAQAQHLREGSSWSFPYFAIGGRPSGRQGL